MGRKEGNPKHSLSGTVEYCTWISMRERCLCKTNKSYHNYGGRGITICKSWLDSPVNFVADMGLKPSPNHAIDRIDNNKSYSKDNCRWVTQEVNNRNSRQCKIWVLDGVEYGSATLAAECLSVSRAVIRDRCLGRNGKRIVKAKDGCYTKMLYN